MKKALLTFILICSAIYFSQAKEKVYPAIQGYGAINPIPFETLKPDPSKQYRYVTELGYGIEDKKEVSIFLDYAARMYNAHIYAGIPKENMDLGFVIFSGQTTAALSNEEYEKRFDIPNPNAPLLEELKAAGVRVIVCGQSMMKQNLAPDMIYPGMEMAVSRFTATSDLMHNGYLIFPL